MTVFPSALITPGNVNRIYGMGYTQPCVELGRYGIFGLQLNSDPAGLSANTQLMKSSISINASKQGLAYLEKPPHG